MIIGNGLLASNCEKSTQLKNRKDILIFASGVSNSKENRAERFNLEKELFDVYSRIHGDSVTYVYFSSCALSNPAFLKIPYYHHKNEMEKIIISTGRYLILRVPQILNFSSNPNTIINFFKNAIVNNNQVNIQKNAQRYLILLEDVVEILEYLTNGKEYLNKTIDIINPYQYSALALFSTMANVLGKMPKYSIVEGGLSYSVDTITMENIIKALNIGDRFGDQYLQKYLEENIHLFV